MRKWGLCKSEKSREDFYVFYKYLVPLFFPFIFAFFLLIICMALNLPYWLALVIPIFFSAFHILRNKDFIYFKEVATGIKVNDKYLIPWDKVISIGGDAESALRPSIEEPLSIKFFHQGKVFEKYSVNKFTEAEFNERMFKIDGSERATDFEKSLNWKTNGGIGSN